MGDCAPTIARDLPWIGVGDPWAVLVSEVMLQQTQAARVIEPWRRFMESLPTVDACADAPRAVVIALWGGLGYNRRAGYLQDTARVLVEEFDGHVPSDPDALRQLPGVGGYTANAVASFAFGERVGVLDTNVGRVLARALVNRPLGRSEAQRLADELVRGRDSAAHNQAMLDLGAQFCTATPRCHTCPMASRCAWRAAGGPDPAQRSAAVSVRQSAFAGSDRQCRGRIIAVLRDGPTNPDALSIRIAEPRERVERLIAALVGEGLVEYDVHAVRLVDDTREPTG